MEHLIWELLVDLGPLASEHADGGIVGVQQHMTDHMAWRSHLDPQAPWF